MTRGVVSKAAAAAAGANIAAARDPNPSPGGGGGHISPSRSVVGASLPVGGDKSKRHVGLCLGAELAVLLLCPSGWDQCVLI